MAKATTPPHRVRLTVPADDRVTLEWLEAQASVSASLRVLVREAMAAHGPIDALSRPLPGALPQAPAAAVPAPARKAAPAQQAGPSREEPREVEEASAQEEGVPAAGAPDERGEGSTRGSAGVEVPQEPAPGSVAEHREQPASGLGDVNAFLSQNRD